MADQVDDELVWQPTTVLPVENVTRLSLDVAIVVVDQVSCAGAEEVMVVIYVDQEHCESSSS